MSAAVRVERDGAVAVVIIDNPPVNAGSREVRAGIIAAIAEVAGDPACTGAVLIGHGTTFISGSDIREFAGPIAEPQMPAVIAAIEQCPKPVVAALSGSALGGGLEIALGCDARIALAGTLVGLPEVTLGIIPGAGGTVRLPRLIGTVAAIDLIASGKRITAEEAARLGLIDTVVTSDLRGAAVALAASLGAKRRITDRPVPPADESAVAAAADAAIRKGRSRPAIVESVAAVRRASALPTSEALRVERATFQQLRESEEAAALRYLFFAERAALRAVAPVAEARTVRAVGVIGAGTMGAGIAAAFIDAGLAAWLIDVDDAAVARGLSRVRETEDRAVRTGRIAQADADARLARLRPSTRLADIAGADLVIEAVFEDIDAKTAVLRDVAAATAAGTIIASNTSYLDLDVLAAATPRPTDVVGLHFFAPANVMRLVEVVRGKATSDAAFSAAFSVVKRLGKLPIVSGVCEGFIGNRLYSAYRMQCEFMLEEGCLPAQVDAALEAFGFAMGPFAVGDLSGLDIAWRNRKRLAASRDPRSRYAPALDRLCEMGRFGRKAGAGWYAYAAPDSEKAPDPIVHALIEQIARDKGIARRAFSDAEIVTRAMGALVNEAALLLAEGITSRPADIDLVMVNGFGFPKHRGGPVFWATRLPRAEVERAVDQVEAAAGHGFRRGNLDLVLRPTPTRD